MSGPAVVLMHNASSYHALPSLLSDMHEALGALGRGNTSNLRIGESHDILRKVKVTNARNTVRFQYGH